ncbi:MAG: hypothetical protein L6R35_006496, partial [Caloplaca aegaea]
RDCILKDDVVEKLEPDDSISFPGAAFPFIVFEVRDAQPVEDLQKKVRIWFRGSQTMVKIVCVLEIEPDDNQHYRLLASVCKAVRKRDPKDGKPNRYVLEKTWVINKEDVSTERSSASFTISAAEMKSKNAPQKLTPTNSVTISFASYYYTAVNVIEEKVAEKKREAAAKGPDAPKYDSNQSNKSSSVSSSGLTDEIDSEISGEGEDDTADGDSDFEP